MIEKALADEKVGEGWLKLWLAFEALGAKEDKTKEALERLIGKLEEDKKVKMYKKEFTDTKKVEMPNNPKIKESYTLTCETELVVDNFDTAINNQLCFTC